MYKHRSILLVALFVSLTACGDTADAPGPSGPSGSSGTGGASNDGGIVIPGLMTISVTAADEAEVGPAPPPTGQTHVVLHVAVNNGLDTSHMVSPVAFWIVGSDGLERVGSPLTELLPTGCPSDAMLSAGASTQCQLAFVIPASLTIEKLLYRDGLTTAEAAVPPVTACDRCGDRCTDLSSNPQHCGSCDRIAPSNSSCVGGEIQCTESGALACPSASGTVTCLLPTTPEHCGGCGVICDAIPGSLGECHEGVCLYPTSSFFGNCNQICSQFGLACAFSEQCGSVGDCNATQVQGCHLTCYCRQ